jgi:nicotinate-nucleotide--dimethylbenzimidazole phosphoribosyltransferase
MDFNISKVSLKLKGEIQKKINEKTKPLSSLGKLEDTALQVALIQNTLSPQLNNPSLIVFAGDHGICKEGVSAYPQEVTYQMVMNYLNGGAAVNVFCRQNNINIKVVDSGVAFDFVSDMNLIKAKVGYGTKNFLYEPAMSTGECELAIKNGAEITEQVYENGCNVIGFGEMGIGNTSSAAIIINQLIDLPLEVCVGKGTGLADDGVNKKLEILKKSVKKHNSISKDPMAILSTFGGFEIAMICGAILKAAELKMVIIIDGFIVTSALLAAYKMDSAVIDYCIFSHQSDEKGHRYLLEELNVEPLLNLNMRLGEGTGVAVTYPIIQAAVNFLNEMASFNSAGVSGKND